LELFGDNIQFVQSVKYLGINLVSDKKVNFSVDHKKMIFFGFQLHIL